MKVKIFSIVKPTPDSTVASTRIATFLQEQLQLPIVWDGSIADEQLDVLVMINGATAFCNCRSELSEAVANAGRVLWVQNDYILMPAKDTGGAQSPWHRGFIRRREEGRHPVDYWTTVEANANRTTLSRYINWNALTHVQLPRPTEDIVKDLYYYGAFRDGRKKLFDKWFTVEPERVTISSTSKKFAEAYPECLHVRGMPRSEFYSELGRHGFGLYIEDIKTSQQFMSPANRFYEMLSAHLPMVFDPACVPMMDRAGFDVAKFVGEPKEFLYNMVNSIDREAWRAEQQRLWAKPYRANLETQVKATWATYRAAVSGTG